MKTALIYQDYIENNGPLLRRMENRFGPDSVRLCDARDIESGILNPENIFMFVIPGGADLYYCEKLNGAGNAAIRRYVEQGGVYFGICAGAYYACDRIEWAGDQPVHAICGTRELGFFNGVAVGPVYEFFEDRNIDKSWDRAVTLRTATGKTATSLYRAGPVFHPAEEKSCTILARFAGLHGEPAALIGATIGKGRAILSSCHIEFTPDLYARSLYRHRNESSKWTDTVSEEFQRGWSDGTDLWDETMNTLFPSEPRKAA